MEESAANLLADPHLQDHPLRQTVQELLDLHQRHTVVLERIMRIADQFQWAERERGLGYADRYERQVRKLEKIVRISDHYQRLLRENETHLRLLTDNMTDVIWTMGPDLRFDYVSPSVERLRGFAPQEVLGQSLEQVMTARSAAQVQAFLQQVAGRATPAQASCIDWRQDVEEYRHDGSTVWTEVSLRVFIDEQRQVARVLGVSRNISQRKSLEDELRTAHDHLQRVNEELRRANEALEVVAFTDRLTGTWNRRRFEDIAHAEMARAARYRQNLSIILFDIDHFKRVNDTHGHNVGDQVLVQVSDIVRMNLRSTDALARWGGEEFLVLAPHASLQQAAELADKLRDKVAACSMDPAGHITISCGVAEFLWEDTLSNWIDRADQALYQAKDAGRNRVVCSAHSNPAVASVALFDLTWGETCDSGDAQLDLQRAQIFADANLLLSELLNGEDDDTVLAMLQRMLVDTRRCLAEEERSLARIGFPRLAAHRAEHQHLLERFAVLVDAVQSGTQHAGDVFPRFAYDLVTRHMMGSDRQFFGQLARASRPAPQDDAGNG